jgi:hypothetical protein
MCEVIPFDAGLKRSSSLSRQGQQLSYETYLAYRQAEEAFRAFYFGRALDLETIENRPSTKILRRNWSAVERLAGTLLQGQSLTREQIVKLLQANLDAVQVNGKDQ